jgi:hypothetical protein
MKQNKLKTKAQCEQLLADGYTLQNIHGHTVCLNSDGEQIISNPRRTRKYSFSHQYYWSICKEPTTSTVNGVSSDVSNNIIVKGIEWVCNKLLKLKSN